jgi:hypothetical protein
VDNLTRFQSKSIVIAALVCAAAADTINAPGKSAATAQIGPATPLPVFVTNEGNSLLPEGFEVGSRWRFTSWSSPTTTSFVGAVQATAGPWANLTVRANDGTTTTRWYNVAAMPGGWEKQ